MKRLLLLVPLALLLSGYSLLDFNSTQPTRLRWEVDYRGAAYNTEVPESANLRHCFRTAGYGSPFFPAFFRTAGFQCSYSVAGTDDAGTNGVWMQISHEDGGIDCKCNIGVCDGTPSTEMGCTCADGGYSYVQLGMTVMDDAGQQLPTEYCVQVSSDTDCWTNPAGLSCSIDLFR
jgi:hypothetical protein